MTDIKDIMIGHDEAGMSSLQTATQGYLWNGNEKSTEERGGGERIIIFMIISRLIRSFSQNNILQELF